MRPQPKLYARIKGFGLNTLVSMSDISRINIGEADPDNVIPRCIIITYVDGFQHVLDSKELSGENWKHNCDTLIDLLIICATGNNAPDETRVVCLWPYLTTISVGSLPNETSGDSPSVVLLANAK